MADLILAALKPALGQMIDRLKAAVPGYVDALILWLVTVPPASVDKVTAAFRTLYTDITTRLVAWLPSTKAPLVRGISGFLEFVKTKALAKL
jgi:hypothetical protein